MGKQLHARLAADAVGLILAKFNHGDITAAEACVRLGVCRSRLYTLRAEWLRSRGDFTLGHSGGDNTPGWTEKAVEIAGRLVIRRDRFWIVEDDPLKNPGRWPAKLGSFRV